MGTTPTVRRLVLSNELKRLRGESGVTPEQAARHLGCRVSKISRIVDLERDAATPRSVEVEVSFVLSESYLRRQVGGREVMAEQLDCLAEMARLHNVQIQVLPFNARTFAGRGR